MDHNNNDSISRHHHQQLLHGQNFASAGAASTTATAAATDNDDEVGVGGGDVNVDDSDSEGEEDGDLPLATPFPWDQDDYELTLHHEPKRRKLVGSGMVYLKRLLAQPQHTEYNDDGSKYYDETTVLSDPAKVLLKQLVKQHTKPDGVKTTNAAGAEEDSSEDDESDEDDEEEDDDEDGGEAQKKRKHLAGPRLWTTGLESPLLQQRNDGDGDNRLFASILKIMDDAHPLVVTARHIIRLCALKMPPGAPPGCMDAKDMICCALHWLTSEWTSPDPSQLPSLPLIRSVTAPGNARDLERHSYEKATAWAYHELRGLEELERLFFHSPHSGSSSSHANNLRWLSRVRFCPRPPKTGKGKDNENAILLKGTIPARMIGKKKMGQGKRGPNKKKTTTTTSTSSHGNCSVAAAAAVAATTTPVSTTSSTGTNKVAIRVMDQGKQFPFFQNYDYDDDDDDDDDDDESS